MSISNISGVNGLSSIASILDPSNIQSTDGTSGTLSSPAASATISKPGELFGKLSQLSQQDPAEFKQVTQSISDELKSAAQGATGQQAQFLNELAGKFSQAASSGDASVLQPGGDKAGAASGHHHHHHGGAHGASGGGSGGIEAVLTQALDQVNQALSGSDPAQASVATPIAKS
ncbi:MAG TPA: hypothetical protein VGI10_15965 [Polyangiaceae bacterium]|jgi:flagellar hook-basal body complex protein FliE